MNKAVCFRCYSSQPIEGGEWIEVLTLQSSEVESVRKKREKALSISENKKNLKGFFKPNLKFENEKEFGFKCQRCYGPKKSSKKNRERTRRKIKELKNISKRIDIHETKINLHGKILVNNVVRTHNIEKQVEKVVNPSKEDIIKEALLHREVVLERKYGYKGLKYVKDLKEYKKKRIKGIRNSFYRHFYFEGEFKMLEKSRSKEKLESLINNSLGQKGSKFQIFFFSSTILAISLIWFSIGKGNLIKKYKDGYNAEDEDLEGKEMLEEDESNEILH